MTAFFMFSPGIRSGEFSLVLRVLFSLLVGVLLVYCDSGMVNVRVGAQILDGG